MDEEQEDIHLTCIGLFNKPCGAQFVWSVEDQQFYKDRNFAKPKRCKPCAKLKRAEMLEREKTQ